MKLFSFKFLFLYIFILFVIANCVLMDKKLFDSIVEKTGTTNALANYKYYTTNMITIYAPPVVTTNEICYFYLVSNVIISRVSNIYTCLISNVYSVNNLLISSYTNYISTNQIILNSETNFNGVFVSHSTNGGNNANSGLTPSNPLRAISVAISNAISNNRKFIFLQAIPFYSHNLDAGGAKFTLTNLSDIKIIGGFSSDYKSIIGKSTLVSYSENSAIIKIYNSDNLRFENLVISNGYSTTLGGGIYLSNVSYSIFTNCIFAWNRAFKGGGLYWTYGISNFIYADFISNAGEVNDNNEGGGLYISFMTNSLIKGNFYTNGNANSTYVTYASGFQLTSSKNITIVGRFILNIVPNYLGGALRINGCDDITVKDSYFLYNKAYRGGAAISIHNTTNLNIISSEFISNSITGGGNMDAGGILVFEKSANVTISNNIFKNNDSQNSANKSIINIGSYHGLNDTVDPAFTIIDNLFIGSHNNSDTFISEQYKDINGHTIKNNIFFPINEKYFYNYFNGSIVEFITNNYLPTELNTANDPDHDASIASGNKVKFYLTQVMPTTINPTNLVSLQYYYNLNLYNLIYGNTPGYFYYSGSSDLYIRNSTVLGGYIDTAPYYSGQPIIILSMNDVNLRNIIIEGTAYPHTNSSKPGQAYMSITTNSPTLNQIWYCNGRLTSFDFSIPITNIIPPVHVYFRTTEWQDGIEGDQSGWSNVTITWW